MNTERDIMILNEKQTKGIRAEALAKEYFVENDYLHHSNARNILLEGFTVGADYVSLYDHPDKYLNANEGGNPFIEDGGEVTKVYLSKGNRTLHN